MEEWLASLVTVAILFGCLIILVLSMEAFNLCEDNNRWGIVLFSFVLPIVGTIFALVYFEKHYHLFSKSKRKSKSRKNKSKVSKVKKKK